MRRNNSTTNNNIYASKKKGKQIELQHFYVIRHNTYMHMWNISIVVG